MVKSENRLLSLSNLYSATTENEHCIILSDLSNMLEKNMLYGKSIVFGGSFNLFFLTKLEAQGGNPELKKKSLVKLIEIKEKMICLIFGELEIQM